MYQFILDDLCDSNQNGFVRVYTLMLGSAMVNFEIHVEVIPPLQQK
jgi:hypothetical protein